MNSGLPVISCGISIPSATTWSARCQKVCRLQPLSVLITNVNQRNWQVGVCRVCLPVAGSRICSALPWSAVISSFHPRTQPLSRLLPRSDPVLQRFNRRFHHPGVTYHVAVRIVQIMVSYLPLLIAATSFSVSLRSSFPVADRR